MYSTVVNTNIYKDNMLTKLKKTLKQKRQVNPYRKAAVELDKKIKWT